MDISRRPKFPVGIEMGGIPNLRNRLLNHMERSILDNLTLFEKMLTTTKLKIFHLFLAYLELSLTSLHTY